MQARYVFCFAALPVGALAFQAKATDLDLRPVEQATPSDWIITLGADGRVVPRYMGSNQWATVPVPYVDRHRPGKAESFHSPRDGTGVALFDSDVLAVGPVGSLTWPRRQLRAYPSMGLATSDTRFRSAASSTIGQSSGCACVSRRCKAWAPPTA
jgi:outer membrane scaffolding protein for murein synthesis (MipA/OmpV family)